VTNPTMPLSEACAFRHGGTPSKSNPQFWGGEIPWVSPKDMKASLITSTQDSITAKGVDGSAASVVPAGSILVVARSGILAHTVPVARAGRPLAFNQDIKAIQVTDNRVTGDYVYWFLRGKEAEILSRGVKKGATVHSLQSGFLEKLAIPIASAPEQRRIVDLLYLAENIVRMRRYAEQKAKEIIPALFLDVFGNPESGSPIEGQRELMQVASFGDSTILQIIDGDRGEKYPKKADFDSSGDCLFLSTSNVRQGFWDFTKCDFISEAKDKELRKGKMQRDDVVLTTRGTLGYSAHYDQNVPFSSVRINSGMVILRARCDVLLPAYLLGVVNSDVFDRQMEALTSGSAQPQLPIRALSKITFPVPSIDSQRRFVTRFKQARDLVLIHARASEHARQVFQSLLTEVFQH